MKLFDRYIAIGIVIGCLWAMGAIAVDVVCGSIAFVACVSATLVAGPIVCFVDWLNEVRKARGNG